MEIASFLGRYPPFDGLDAPALEGVAAEVRIEFFPAGTAILDQGGDPAGFMYVVHKGAVELLEEGLLLDLLGEGEVFGHLSLLSGMSPAFTVRAHEDTICYLIEKAAALEILSRRQGLTFLSASLRRRMARAVEVHEAAGDPRHAAVGSLIRRPPVMCPAATTVREASRVMTAERTSCVLVPNRERWGILTDRDLRSRVLAEERSPDVSVAEVMSFPADTVPAETPAAEVLLLMLERGIHHFPVVDPGGRLLGVVTDTDLMGLERRSPFALRSEIERAVDRDAVVTAARGLPAAVCALVGAGVDAVHVGHAVAVTVDALTRRLIELAVDGLGPPPAPWAWMALGSEARREQGLGTDQDHALAFDPGERPAEEIDAYFGALAEAVTAGLEACGIPRCRAGVVAAERALRRTLDEWVQAFQAWVSDPGPEAVRTTTIVFDYRRVAGPLEVDAVLDDIIRTTPRNLLFRRRLAHTALDLRPPTGFFRDLVVERGGAHRDTLDLKQGGVTIIVDLARSFSVGQGLTEKPTLARLESAVEHGWVDAETGTGLAEAFRLLLALRLDHQCRQIAEGRAPDSHLDPTTLGPLSRIALKEAFRTVARSQRNLATQLGLRVR